MLEFVVLKKNLKNPIHPSLGCFSHLRLAFIFLDLKYNKFFIKKKKTWFMGEFQTNLNCFSS